MSPPASGPPGSGPGASRLRPIADVATDLGWDPRRLHPAAPGVLRLPVSEVRARAATASRGRIVLVSAMTPTEHGEGKTVVSIGLAMALRRRGRRSVVCLRQPSLGPVFGSKGGASGGGRSAVEPRPEIDLGFTGDLDAITNAQNLLASLVDHRLFVGNAVGLDPARPGLPRASPLEDRALRDLVAGTSVKRPGFPRPAQFVITPATEMAAIHGLAGDYADLKARIERMIVGRRTDGRAVVAHDVGPIGAVAALLRTALEPNLAQTLEGTPALIHGVPYANVAHGTCSRLAIEAAIASAEYAVVEAGFSTDLGAEKFVDLVGPATGLAADAAVLVVSVRAVRWHGSGPGGEGADALERGLGNVEQHVDNLRRMGLDPVVAINEFPDDDAAALARVQRFCDEHRLAWARVRAFAEGGAGALDLADRVVEAAARGQRGHPLYPGGTPLERILETLVTQVYGGVSAELTPAAVEDLALLRADGDPDGPVCLAKTPLSLSADAQLRGRPRGFTVSVRRILRWRGAGFTVVVAGPIVSMPGLPSEPAADRIDLRDDGTVTGLD